MGRASAGSNLVKPISPATAPYRTPEVAYFLVFLAYEPASYTSDIACTITGGVKDQNRTSASMSSPAEGS